MSRKNILALALVSIFLVGIGYIIWSGRPVMQVQQKAPLNTPSENPVQYSMAEVAVHATLEDCWAVIHGAVYDLTTWVERHPGGGRAIAGLCGTDGSSKFEQKHGGSTGAQAALILLKIGEPK